jgi:ParB-like chromosome segregation protein Spo0J
MEITFREGIDKLRELSDEEKLQAINEIKLALHEISPLKSEPVDCVIWVKNDLVIANDYNPNKVAPPEMKLLAISVGEDGYTQPIVTSFEEGHYTVIDGFHRTRVGKEDNTIIERVKGYLPVTIINPDREGRCDRIASTIRHNRARGKHTIAGMTDIIVELKRRNHSNEWIARELGMDADEILRLSQISGLAEMFADKSFSEAWEAENVLDNPEIEHDEDELGTEIVK